MKTVRIEFRSVETKKDAHKAIKEALGFPDYYGGNLDALYDCLTEFCADTLIVIRYSSALKKLGEYGESLLQTFKDAEEAVSSLSVVVTEQ